MKALIVDDSTVMRQMIEKVLLKMDLEIVGQAGDGVAALEIFADEKPDLVTMDITMPNMDGLTCMEKMLEIKPSTNIIVVTALRNEETNFKALELGAADFINKPFSPEQIEEAVRGLDED